MRITIKQSFVFVSIIVLVLSQAANGQIKHLLPKGIYDLLANEISGEEAFQHVVNLSGWPKNRPEEEYKGTFYEAQYILNKASEYGLENTDIEYFPWEYQNWDPITAELRVVEPVQQKVTGLDMVHLCLVENSKSTDTTAQLIDVGEGTSPADYEGKDVSGKIVLSKGYVHLVNRLAVKERGALGIINYQSLYSDEHPDMVSWSAFLPVAFGGDDIYTFGFMISPRQGLHLKRLLKTHKRVVVKAHVKSQTHPGKLDVINTVIKGSKWPDEEILIMAHLFEYYYKQGANDNKSGSAAILEIARVINKLVHENKIPPPKRSLRVFWEPEGWGSFAWMAKYPQALSRLKAVIDMDMVGESHQKCGSVFHVFTTPDSLPHFFNDVLTHFTEYIGDKSGIGERITTKSSVELIASPTGSRDPFYHQIIHFNPRMFSENWIGVPSTLFHCGPDPFYHSSEDRPDKCDPTQLKRAAFLGASLALYLANLDREDIPVLTSLVLGAGEERLGRDQKKALALLAQHDGENVHENYKEARNLIHRAVVRERGILASIGKYLHLSVKETDQLRNLFNTKDESAYSSVEQYYGYLCRLLKQKPIKPTLSGEEKRLDNYTPKRIIGHEYSTDFLYLENALKDKKIKEKLNLYKSGRLVPWEALNFVDGQRSILDIRNALSAEFSPVKIRLADVEEYMKALAKAGVIEIGKK